MRVNACAVVLCGLLLFAYADTAEAGQVEERPRQLLSDTPRVKKPTGETIKANLAASSSTRLLEEAPTKLSLIPPKRGLAATNIADLGLGLEPSTAARTGVESLAVKPWVPGRGVGVKVEVTW
jgi:hypothetical protein